MNQLLKKFAVTALAATVIMSYQVSPFTGAKVYATGADAQASNTTASTAQGGTASTNTTAADNGSDVSVEQKENLSQSFKNLQPHNFTVPEGFEEVGKSDKVTLYANMTNGEVAIKNNENGFVWRSNPEYVQQDAIAQASGKAFTNLQSQFLISYTQGVTAMKQNSKDDSVDKGGLTAKKVDNGVKFIYKFPRKASTATTDFKDKFTGNKNNASSTSDKEVQTFVVPIQYTVEDDGVVAQVLTTDPEAVLSFTETEVVPISFLTAISSVETEVDYNITELAFLPYMGAGGLNEDGYLVIPDGSGAIVNFNNGKSNFEPYKAPVYGAYRDSEVATYSAMKDNVRLPIFGIVKEDNGQANSLLGVIEENEAVGIINASVSSYDTSYNNVYSTLLHKIIDTTTIPGKAANTQPMSPKLMSSDKNYTVKFYPLSGENADYTGMARKYQEYLVNEKGMKKNEDEKDTPIYLDMYAGVEKETSVLGVPTTVFEPMTTYEDLRTIVSDLNNEGINDIVIKYSDWMSKSSRGKVAAKVKYNGTLGGKSQFKKTVKFMDEKGVDFYPNIDFVNFAKNGNGYNGFFDSAKSASMKPAFQFEKVGSHINLGDRWYLLKPPLVEEVSQKFLKSYQKAGIADVSLESLGDTIYSDSSADGMSRGDAIYVWEQIIQDYKAAGGKVMMTNTSAFSLPYIDSVMSVPSPDSYAEITDKAIPFYQTAIRGYVPYSSESINLSSNSKDAVLKAVESGSALTYSFIMQDPSSLKETYLNYLFSCDYSLWKDSMLEEYNAYKDVMEKIKGQPIKDHEYLNDELVKTTYDNGVSVYVNYSDQDTTVDGNTIKAKSYLAVGGEIE